MKALYVMSFILLWTVKIGFAQEDVDIEQLLEANEVARSDDQYEDMLAVLQRLRLAPLNLNTVGFDSLNLLFFLSDSQIDNILAFRKKYGAFFSPDELLLVPGIGKRDLENIRQFLYTGKEPLGQRRKVIRPGIRQELITRGKINFPRQEGYKRYSPEDFKTEGQYLKKVKNRFRGIPLGTLVRYKAQVHQHLQMGLTLENDPGEAYFTKYQKTGFDFCSVYAALSTERWMKRLILGDYRLQWGQGLVAWSGFASGKSAVALGNEKSARGITPYTSTDENNFLRGIALSLQPFPNLNTEVFFSGKKTDGNILETDRLSEEDILTASLYQSGYHRNENECEKKHTLKEWTTGASVNWNTPYFKTGLHVLYYHFKPGIGIGDKLYQQYNDDGQNRLLTGIDYKTGFRSLYFFGETAWSEKREVATLNGIRYSGSSRVALALLYRRYAKGYISRYAGGFGEYSNTSNEEGIYLGMDLNLIKKLKLNVYYDHFRFFSARYNSTVPASGDEISVNMSYEYSLGEHIFRLKYEEKPEDWKGEIKATAWRKKLELRYQLGIKCNTFMELRTRLDWMHYIKADKRENGYMIYQDLIYSRPAGNLKMQFRLAYFNTDSYNSRIYSYEHNVLYGYSFPAYYDRGIRTYLNLNWQPAAWLALYAKSGWSYYPGRETLGASVTAIEDNKVFDFTFQLRFRF
ncbi:MAG: helix-hairpin-helix domain-containing protein [Oscillibacter sp.]|nr:helix-hairpin-helix domain-containing protein [Oscillibacter sp.]